MVELNLRLQQRAEMNEKAINAALVSLNARLDGMNEFRAALKDQGAGFVTRAEWEAGHTAVENDIRALQLFKENTQGRSQQTMMLLGGFFTILNIAMALYFRRAAMPQQLRENRENKKNDNQ